MSPSYLLGCFHFNHLLNSSPEAMMLAYLPVITLKLIRAAIVVYFDAQAHFSWLLATNLWPYSIQMLFAGFLIRREHPFSKFGYQKPSVLGSTFCQTLWSLITHFELQSTDSSYQLNSANYHFEPQPRCCTLPIVHSHSDRIPRKTLACTTAWAVRPVRYR